MRTELQTAMLRARIARQTPQVVMARPSLQPLPPLPEIGPEPVTETIERPPVVSQPPRWGKINRIIWAACRHFNISRADLVGPCRQQWAVHPRHSAMHACKKYTTASLPEIAYQFGKRDHTTILHAARKIARLLDDDRVAADCEDLARAIGEVT